MQPKTPSSFVIPSAARYLLLTFVAHKTEQQIPRSARDDKIFSVFVPFLAFLCVLRVLCGERS
jgi:hypothetical protein